MIGRFQRHFIVSIHAEMDIFENVNMFMFYFAVAQGIGHGAFHAQKFGYLRRGVSKIIM